MVLEGPDCSFGGIDSVFVRGDTLEANLVAEKGVLEVLGALVVKNVQVGGVALVDQQFVGGFPSVPDGGGLPVGNGHGVDGVGVLVIQDENVIVPAAGGNRKTAGLVGEGLQSRRVVKERGAELV